MRGSLPQPQGNEPSKSMECKLPYPEPKEAELHQESVGLGVVTCHRPPEDEHAEVQKLMLEVRVLTLQAPRTT